MSKDKLLELLEDASCNGQCPYGVKVECDDCIKRMVVEHDAEIRRQTLDEFISKAEEERDDIFNWDDDEYYNGMKCGYQYSIEIAEQMKGE